MFIYENKNIFLQALHPLVVFLYLAVVAAAGLLISHPWGLLLLSGLALFILQAAGGLGDWLRGLRYFFPLALAILVINSLVNSLGKTVLWSLDKVLFLGDINLTLENLWYSLAMLTRMMIVLSAFMAYNLVMNPDRALGLFGRVFPHSVLLVALTAKTLPCLSRKMQRAAEIQQCRGVNYHRGSIISRIKNRLPLLKVLFLSSLEDSFSLAESIQARAFGSGPRTSYSQGTLGPGDYLVLFFSLAAAGALSWSSLQGWTGFQYYPEVAPVTFTGSRAASFSFITLCLLMPAVLAWGWDRWELLRWKI